MDENTNPQVEPEVVVGAPLTDDATVTPEDGEVVVDAPEVVSDEETPSV